MSVYNYVLCSKLMTQLIRESHHQIHTFFFSNLRKKRYYNSEMAGQRAFKTKFSPLRLREKKKKSGTVRGWGRFVTGTVCGGTVCCAADGLWRGTVCGKGRFVSGTVCARTIRGGTDCQCSVYLHRYLVSMFCKISLERMFKFDKSL